MRVAYIGQKGIPATFGGVEYHVDKLSREMAALGHDVTVYVRSWYTAKNLKEYEGVRLIHVPTIKSKHLDASVHSFLCSIHALFGKFDIIHYHGIGPAFFAIIPRLFRKKVVATVHRLDWETEKWRSIAKSLLKAGEHISITVPERTIAVSEELTKYVKNKYDKVVIHLGHGTDLPESIAPAIIKEKYDLNGRDYILFMGRLVPEKRVDWLIKAFQDLKGRSSESSPLKLVIAGGSSATPEYVKKLKDISEGSSDIIFTGYVSGTEKEELLSNARLFSLPSHLEGFPIALLEAKSYGLCCLVSDIPPHLEAIRSGMNGLLFRSDDFEDLRQKLQELINDHETLEKLGANAREEMKNLPGWKIVVKKIESIYEELL
ncbi:MAG: glycosyltransferase family 4 protein [Candidatus Aminicenantes bacterium]|jgi:glycosyltransferase involved in cell wall biosynthesis